MCWIERPLLEANASVTYLVTGHLATLSTNWKCLNSDESIVKINLYMDVQLEYHKWLCNCTSVVPKKITYNYLRSQILVFFLIFLWTSLKEVEIKLLISRNTSSWNTAGPNQNIKLSILCWWWTCHKRNHYWFHSWTHLMIFLCTSFSKLCHLRQTSVLILQRNKGKKKVVHSATKIWFVPCGLNQRGSYRGVWGLSIWKCLQLD